jgi:hypothetical protein
MLSRQYSADEVIPRAVGMQAGLQTAVVVDLNFPVQRNAKAGQQLPEPLRQNETAGCSPIPARIATASFRASGWGTGMRG